MRRDTAASEFVWRRFVLHWLPSLITLALVLVVGYVGERAWAIRSLERARAHAVDQLSTLRARLEGEIYGNVLLVQGLVAHIAGHPTLSQEDFTRLAAELMRNKSALRNIGAAPDMVIRYLYPLAGNEEAFGLDYRRLPNQRDAAIEAMQSGDVVVAGPVDLVQGGRGLIGRAPVFVPEERGSDGTKKFWGLVSAVIDADMTFRRAGLLDPNLPIEISIRGHDGKGESGAVFFGHPGLFSDDAVLMDVSLPGGEWQIAAKPKGGWEEESAETAMIRQVKLFVAMLLAGLAYLRSKEMRNRHQAEVALRDSEERFRQLAENIREVFWVFDVKPQRAVYVSGAFEQIWGQSTLCLNDKPDCWLEQVHADDREAARIASTLPAKGAPVDMEYRLLATDGSRRWIWDRRFPVYGHRGEVTRVVGIAEDITERKLAEEDRLKLARQQRDALVREVHHHIKNNLQGIIGLMHHHVMDNPQLKPILGSVISQVESIAVVHGIQGKRGNGAIPLVNVLMAIVDSVRSFSRIPLELAVSAEVTEHMRLAKEHAVPIALVINEMVTNAQKHAVGGTESVVRIGADADQHGIRIKVRNPGTLFSQVDLQRGEGLGTGLSLVRSLLPRQGAVLTLTETDNEVVTVLRLGTPAVLQD